GPGAEPAAAHGAHGGAGTAGVGERPGRHSGVRQGRGGPERGCGGPGVRVARGAGVGDTDDVVPRRRRTSDGSAGAAARLGGRGGGRGRRGGVAPAAVPDPDAEDAARTVRPEGPGTAGPLASALPEGRGAA